MFKEFIRKWKEGYDFAPWKPYSCPEKLRRQRAWCNALSRHTPARDGSWSFGATVCGKCGMNYNIWSDAERKAAADAINRLPQGQLCQPFGLLLTDRRKRPFASILVWLDLGMGMANQIEGWSGWVHGIKLS